jgi:hypothetical protein
MTKTDKFRPKSALDDPDRRKRIAAEMTRRNLSNWMLMESLAFAERWGVACITMLFLLDLKRDFWSVPGVVFSLLQLAIMSPVYGILVYLTFQGVYRARRMIKKRINSMAELKKTGYAVYIFWAGLLYFFTYACFDMYYDLLTLLVKPVIGHNKL